MSYRTDAASAPSSPDAQLELYSSDDLMKHIALAGVIPGVYYDWRVGQLSMPSLAVDASGGPHEGRLYVAWPDARFRRHTSILLAYSDDGGKNWSKPQVVNGRADRGAVNQEPNDFMPKVAVNRDGVVGVSWYDRSDSKDNLSYNVRFAASVDGGHTWLPSVRVSNSPYVPGSDTHYNGGDTAGLAADAAGVFHLTWIANPSGAPAMWTAAVRVHSGRRRPAAAKSTRSCARDVTMHSVGLTLHGLLPSCSHPPTARIAISQKRASGPRQLPDARSSGHPLIVDILSTDLLYFSKLGSICPADNVEGGCIMRAALAFALIMGVSLTGCLSTVKIKAQSVPLVPGDPRDVPGVPFYTKVAMCKQETSWSEPVFTLLLRETVTYKFVDEAAAKKAGLTLPSPLVQPPKTKVLSFSQFETLKKQLDILSSTINQTQAGSDSDLQAITDAWTVISQAPDYVPLSVPEDKLIGSTDVIELSNQSNPELMVDYKTVYFYNAPRPLIGSSQIDSKLASDGTLTEGSSQVQSQTGSTILNTITSVFGGLASKIPAFGGGEQIPPDAKQEHHEFSLTIQRESYTHTHTRYVAFSLPCPVETNGVRTAYALTVTPPGQPQAAKDDSSNIKVSGTVTLPKTPSSPPKQ